MLNLKVSELNRKGLWPELIAGGTALLGGIIGSQASGDAADAQEAAAKYAADLQMQQYMQTRQDLAPWRESGAGGINTLNKMLGLPYYEWVPDAAGQAVQPDGTVSPAMSATGQRTSPRGRGLQQGRVYNQLQALIQGGGQPNIWQTAEHGIPVAAPQQPNQLTQGTPTGAGTPQLTGGLPNIPGGSWVQRPAGEGGPGEFTESPGYQFTLAEGQNAIQNALSAMGRNRSGAHLKSATQYAEDLASTEYDNFLRRWYQSLTPYQSLAGLGLTSGQTTGQLGQQAAAGAGQAQIYAGDASAAGSINQANALTSAITGGVNNILYQNALRNLPGMSGNVYSQNPWQFNQFTGWS